MRRLLLLGAALLGVTLLVVGLLALNLNRLLELNRSRIVAEMARGFARPVQVEHMTIGFHGGLAIEIDGLRIADGPAFSSEAFVTAERTYVVRHLWPLVQRRIEVRRIAVRAPHVTIIRTAHGLNVDSLGRRPEATPPPPAGSPAAAAPGPSPAVAIA